MEIKNLCLFNKNGKEYLYITANYFNKEKYDCNSKIMHGIII